MDKNFSFLNSFSEINETTFFKLQETATLIELEAGKQLVKTGEVPNKLYLLISGMMRVYLSSENGKEFNKKFFLPLSFVASFTALINKEESKLTYEALTECQLYELDFDQFKSLMNNDFSLSKLYIKVLEYAFIDYEKRQLDFISMDATQRYLAFRNEIPNIDKLIPQYQIASYLSITPVQLSRIRKKIKAGH